MDDRRGWWGLEPGGDLGPDARIAEAEHDRHLASVVQLRRRAEQSLAAVAEGLVVRRSVVDEPDHFEAAARLDDIEHLAAVATGADDDHTGAHARPRVLRSVIVAFDSVVAVTAAPVRVLHLIKGLGAGGAERLLVSIAADAEASASRHEVAYVRGDLRDVVPELEALGVATHLLAGPRGMSDPRWPSHLRSLARRFDVVHIHSPAVAAVARPALRTLRRRPAIVSTEHSVWPSHKGLTRCANALTAPLDDTRWAVSEQVVRSMWPWWRGRAEVLVHGIPLERLVDRAGDRSRIREEHRWRDSDVVVVIVANLRAQKDYPTLFRAAAAAIAEEPSLRFVSIGQGPLEAELQALLDQHRLGERFMMIGYHPDPPAVLAGADVFTLSSVHEGLPISLLEAMALGLPPVVTRVGGNAEVVSHGIDGLVVEPRQPDELAAAYVALARDGCRRAALGASAARRAADFDITDTVRTLEDRYRRLAVGSRSEHSRSRR